MRESGLRYFDPLRDLLAQRKQERWNRTRRNQFITAEIVTSSVANDASPRCVDLIFRFAQRQIPDFGEQGSFYITADEIRLIYHACRQILWNFEQLTLSHLFEIARWRAVINRPCSQERAFFRSPTS